MCATLTGCCCLLLLCCQPDDQVLATAILPSILRVADSVDAPDFQQHVEPALHIYVTAKSVPPGITTQLLGHTGVFVSKVGCRLRHVVFGQSAWCETHVLLLLLPTPPTHPPCVCVCRSF